MGKKLEQALSLREWFLKTYPNVNINEMVSGYQDWMRYRAEIHARNKIILEERIASLNHCAYKRDW